MRRQHQKNAFCMSVHAPSARARARAARGARPRVAAAVAASAGRAARGGAPAAGARGHLAGAVRCHWRRERAPAAGAGPCGDCPGSSGPRKGVVWHRSTLGSLSVASSVRPRPQLLIWAIRRVASASAVLPLLRGTSPPSSSSSSRVAQREGYCWSCKLRVSSPV